jgi:hypothetical protein
MFKSIRLATHRFEHYDFYVLNIVSNFVLRISNLHILIIVPNFML